MREAFLNFTKIILGRNWQLNARPDCSLGFLKFELASSGSLKFVGKFAGKSETIYERPFRLAI